jgi:hypothetical protein
MMAPATTAPITPLPMPPAPDRYPNAPSQLRGKPVIPFTRLAQFRLAA